MSGQLHGAAAFQQRFQQRFALFGHSSTTIDDDADRSGNNQQLWPDDPVVDVIKRHLNIGSRIGLEPVSQKFARIAFFCKRRMAMALNGMTVVDGGSLEKSYVELIIAKTSNGGRNCLFIFLAGRKPLAVIAFPVNAFIIPLGRLQNVLHSLFLRIHKWHTIRFIRPDNFVIWGTTWSGIVSQLLEIILDCQVVDIRQLACNLSAADGQKMTDVVRLCSSKLRSLHIPFLISGGGVVQPPNPLLALAQAICACQKLRELRLVSAHPDQFPPEFVGDVLAMSKLTKLFLGYSVEQLVGNPEFIALLMRNRRQFPDLHSLSIDENWLQAIGHLSDLSVLKRQQHLQLMTKSPVETMLDVVWRIVAEMRSPTFVDLVCVEADSSWQHVWQDYLPMVYRTGVDVVRILILGLPMLTAEGLGDGMATLPSLVQLALTLPDLATAPVYDDYYENLTFSFASGAKITFKTFDYEP